MSRLIELGLKLKNAIDKLAEQITGDPKFFSLAHHTAGGRPEELTPRQE
jgi:hypothetical protein